jgi:palmitoyltransferase
MPRRLPVRPAKIIGNIFVCIVLSYIGSLYYFYVFLLWAPYLQSKYFDKLIVTLEEIISQFVLVAFHFLVVMLLWSFFQAMLTDPG